jgi:hypothetical protein
MPLCTVADVKTAARVDPDLTEWDAEIPHLIAAATEEVEQCCNVPAGWFDQAIAPRGIAAARRACIALAALRLDDPQFDARKILSGSLLWSATWYDETPTIGAVIDPAALYMLPDYIADGYFAAA